METLKLKNELFSVGTRDPQLRVFDIIMETEFGTTYNSYLIKGEKNILIETSKAKLWDEYIANIQKVIGSEKIDYIIINHTEPDHSGSLAKLLDIYPGAHVYCSKPASIYLKAIMNRDFSFTTVQDGQIVDLGGKQFKFIMAPFLHWPDTIFTYYMDEKILFSCDGFGCHYCPEEGKFFNSDIANKEGFMRAFRYYYDAIMGPFRDHVITAVGKITGMEISMICPSHGPVINQDIWQYVGYYDKWSHELTKKLDKKLIYIPYVSAYGYTKMIADTLEKSLKELRPDCYVEAVDLVGADLGAVALRLSKADGLLVGSPTLNQDALKPIWDLMSMISPILMRGKPAAAFGSYGWSGEAVKMLEERLKSLKFKVVESGLRFCFMPSAEDLEKTKEFAKVFADLV